MLNRAVLGLDANGSDTMVTLPTIATATRDGTTGQTAWRPSAGAYPRPETSSRHASLRVRPTNCAAAGDGSPRAAPAGALCGVVAGRGDLQHTTDRLDPEAVPMSVHVADYLCERRSSSAPKKAAAVFKISFAAQLLVLPVQLGDP